MQIDRNILLTGASGFIGRKIASELKFNKLNCFGRTDPNIGDSNFYQGLISKEADFSKSLKDIEVVIHTAARVHVMKEFCEDPLEAYREVNTRGTINLAKQASDEGVKRFIFISTIKVNGENTNSKSPFKYNDPSDPKDFYSISKHEAEEGLKSVCQKTGMEFVIIRPPLVYGPGVGGNFLSLISLVKKNLPLPFKDIRNKRSFVGLDNLVSLVATCIVHERANNKTFLVSDDLDISTSDLIRKIRSSCGKESLLFHIPPKLIFYLVKVVGKVDVYERLFEDLQVNIAHTKEVLGWKPRISMDESLKKMMQEIN